MSARKRRRNDSYHRIADEDLHQSPIPQAWDVETDGLGGPIMIASFASDAVPEGAALRGDHWSLLMQLLDTWATFPWTYDYRTQEGVPNVWYAHNHQYDLRYVLDHVEDLQAAGYVITPKMRTDRDIYEIMITYPPRQIRRGRRGPPLTYRPQVCLRDSFAVFNAKLDDFTKMFAPDLPKLHTIDFETTRFDPENPDHVEYSIRDSAALRLAMSRYIDVIWCDYGVPLGATAAGTALAAWRQTLGDKEEYFRTEPHLEKFCRRGYYGGLVFITDNNEHVGIDGEPGATTLDVNSCYPAVMREHGVPGGKPFQTSIYYHPDSMPAMYEITITAPDDLIIPIIPARDAKGNTRLPSGTFDTVCTNVEIQFAIEHGYRVSKIHQGVAWPKWVFPFKKFVDRAEEIRRAAKGTPREFVAKTMQNSVYGKFGSKTLRRELHITTRPAKGMVPLSADHSLGPCMFWVQHVEQKDMLVKPEWAAFITAFARRKLLSAAYAAGVEHVIYGDTDSLTLAPGADLSAIDIGDRYGQFKVEKVWETFRAHAPKQYTGIIDGAWSGKAKGVPKKALKSKRTVLAQDEQGAYVLRPSLDETKHASPYQIIHETGSLIVYAESLQSLIAALGKGFQPATMARRKTSLIVNSANWQLRADGSVRPKPLIATTDSDDNQSEIDDDIAA